MNIKQKVTNNGNLVINQNQNYGQSFLNKQSGMYGISQNRQISMYNNHAVRQSKIYEPEYRQSQINQPFHQNVKPYNSSNIQPCNNSKLPQSSSYSSVKTNSVLNSSVHRSTTRQNVPQM